MRRMPVWVDTNDLNLLKFDVDSDVELNVHLESARLLIGNTLILSMY